MDSLSLRRKNRFKVVRTVFELIVILAFITWVVVSLLAYRYKQKLAQPDAELDGILVSGSEILDGQTPVGKASGTRFIAISYNGLTDTVREGGRIVTKAAYEEQLQALKASGYQTVTQSDLIDYYENNGSLPEKALFLLFEDGIMNTTILAYPALRDNNYIATACTFAGNLSDKEGHYITAKEIQKLNRTTYWETGSNGYRLSYINVFDRYDNYFGNLNASEFADVHSYLKRDYNHYLMDYVRNQDRIRTESVEEMEARIAWDYGKMQETYREQLGYVPALYVLMHSNTGAFGNDPMVSRKNGEMMKSVFSLNFNRQGSCLNTRDSSPYDLSRLQSREYFSANHLMMRIWDDTGDDVFFRTGDPDKADDWERSVGVGEFKERKIILTTLPNGEGVLRFNRSLPENFEISVRLQGNVVGRQTIRLRANEQGEGGVCVSLYDNYLLIEDTEEQIPLLRLDLFRFDGGPFVSNAEEELQGRIALAKTIIANDQNVLRVDDAKLELETLLTIQAPGIADGATAYIPDLDIAQHGDRNIRVRLEGSLISVWLEDALVADSLHVTSGTGNNLFLAAEVTRGSERFSQTNLSDDVYDGVFSELCITGMDGVDLYTYAAPLPAIVDDDPVERTFDKLIDLFHRLYSREE